MEKLKDFDLVRLLRPYYGPDVWEPKIVRSLPAGAIGTAIDVHGDGAGADVEFVLQRPFEDENGNFDEGEFFTIALYRHELEIVKDPEEIKNAF